jgi:Rrf2 family protein
MFNRKVIYGLRSLVYLAEQGRGEFHKTSAIAEATGSPPMYIEVILCGLKNDGIVESKRGHSGGFRLIGDPERISMADILVASDWSPPTVSESGPIGSVLRLAVSAMIRELASFSLAQICSEKEEVRVPCKRCGKQVEKNRECYAFPVCYDCLPPPKPLPVAEAKSEDEEEVPY